VIRQPGFGWGLGVGALAVIAIVGTVALVLGALSYASMNRMLPGSSAISVEPVEAGEPWFELSADGTGVLEGWPWGSFGSGDPGTEKYSFDVFEVGAVDTVPVRHLVTIGVTDDTLFFTGDEQYVPDGNRSAADELFGFAGGMYDPESSIIDGDMKLIIEVRTEDDRLIAVKVTADPDSEPSPMFY